MTAYKSVKLRWILKNKLSALILFKCINYFEEKKNCGPNVFPKIYILHLYLIAKKIKLLLFSASIDFFNLLWTYQINKVNFIAGIRNKHGDKQKTTKFLILKRKLKTLSKIIFPLITI
jgi:hypothetical protein